MGRENIDIIPKTPNGVVDTATKTSLTQNIRVHEIQKGLGHRASLEIPLLPQELRLYWQTTPDLRPAWHTECWGGQLSRATVVDAPAKFGTLLRPHVFTIQTASW